MDKVTADLPSRNISTAGWNIPKDLVLADPSFNKSQPIDLVLGAKHFYSFFPSAARLQLAENLPVLVDSVFGWTVAGSSSSFRSECSPNLSESSTVTISMVTLEESIERFWKNEELVLNDNYSVEARRCETLYQSTVSRNEEGRYIVRGFELRKWTSNELDVLRGLKDEQIGTQSSLQFSPNETIKALGICWEPGPDTLRFDSNIDPSDDPPTKRTILSCISRLFDPLGLIAPVIVKSKLLMQELWLLSCGWDDPLPESVQQKWINIRSELPSISTYRVDRYAFLPNATVQLHVFSDASEAAYGACIYARCEDPEGRVRINLLASKSRVAPLKRITLPRLELCAAVLGAHLYDRVRKAINVEAPASFFWSDSAITLQWIRCPPNTWKTYIANRVSEIQHFTHGCAWNHVAGCENPADLVSRGMTVAEFIESKLWRSGPDWLACPKEDWPIATPQTVPEADLETRMVSVAAVTVPSINPIFLRWSSYPRLLHVVGLCLRFADNCRSRNRPPPSNESTPSTIVVSPSVLRRAKALLIRLSQEDNFAEEIRKLEQESTVGKRSPL
nr:uncharacterized protein LOC115254282 [Aedes albopictus]